MPDTPLENLDLLRNLCETPGIAGREDAVRAVTRDALAGLVDETRVDRLGNLIGVRRGQGGPRVALAAHMDEIGFLVRHVDERGFLRIHPVGGFDASRLPAQRVVVHGRDGARYPGSISVAGTPIHLLKPEEVRPVRVDDLFVDVGLDGPAARDAIEVGDIVTLDRPLALAGTTLMAKAHDDRVGLYVMLEALRALDGPTRAEIVAVATVQEEVGTRGAMTAAWELEPDLGIALDITPAGDFPGAPEEFVGVRLGAGVALKVMDTSSISDRRLNARLREIAAAEEIPVQLEILGRGGTDAGAIQRARGGVAVTALSIPVRYAHTVNETCAPADIAAAIRLVTAAMREA